MNDILNKKIITNSINNSIECFIYDSIDSTNLESKRIINELKPSSFIVLSEEQTAGRGRLGRSFYSPKYTGIYLSYTHRISNINDSVTNITSLVATVVTKVLENNLKINLGIKWVNDIYYSEKKLSGILVESVIENNCIYLIIGIGINVTTTSFPKEIEEIATSLKGYEISKNRIIIEIVNELYDYLKDDKYLDSKVQSEYMSFYKKHSIVIGKEIEYYEQNSKKNGKVIDINSRGELIVENGNDIDILRTGEITLRVVK